MKKLILSLLAVLMMSGFAVSADQDSVYTADMTAWMRTLLYDEAGNTYTDAVCLRLLNLNIRKFSPFVNIGGIDTILITDETVEYALDSDFISTDKVLIRRAGDGRDRALDYRALRRGDPSFKTLGEDAVSTHPRYFNVFNNGNEGFYLKVDPPYTGSATDTVVVYYDAQSIILTAADTLTNIPYSAVSLIVYGAVLDGLIMDRDNPTAQIVMPYIDKQLGLILAKLQERSDPVFKADQ